MNYRIIGYILGHVCCFEGAFLALPFLVALIYREYAVGAAYLGTAVLCTVIGAVFVLKVPKDKRLYTKEGLVAVSLSWILLSVLGALPFRISGEIPHYVDALFETISGFTTTGSSILTDVEAMSHAGLFWRSFTHWVGGMGVLVFILAIIPSRGGAFMNLMKAESPGPSVSKFVPKLRDTAIFLYSIYMGMTIIQLVLLLLGGMPVFDAVTLTMGTAGTGGFAVKNSGIAEYTYYQQAVITIFMILFGVNFNTWFLVVRKKPKQAFKSEEVLTYFAIIAVSVLIITFNILPEFPNLLQSFHHAAFQVASIITTTGYSTRDFNMWPPLSKTILVILMFIGACAGSTGGGIKVSRVIIMVKGIGKEIRMLLHPRSVHKVRMDGRPIEHEVVRSVNVYLAVYVLIFIGSLLIITLDEKDLVTNFTAVAATLNNIGPGLEVVGAAGNFSSFSDLSKLVLCLDMLAGRLELFPMLMLFVPSVWTRHRPAKIRKKEA
ncbi:potassium uptake protein, TrkH family [Marvinbryantia formatexigens DSM 14469]|uniref:Potassium uptake protein, TrkH family n=1 Tax=Marvinbryantia formatexigens DSM 14469 TaxID=478749 RepID=C6LED6_9FIRM|nr:TrkH family potassium uptake protein [Marvinbryantia formatexigens]EET60919.1 potassium uptake protein, TrkH family [Marvinbryantia formatexigens DSM 14469]UWO24783.1 TrkH family potassium uptake protein [Marvinbryantia formatexigens DSM 14469]SDF23210.1 trk system potassium uptake protein TrkH [Marvinbryantia formatexigens]